MLRIGTWNVEYADSAATNARRRALMGIIPADIWVLTETHDDLWPGDDFRALHTPQRPRHALRVRDGSRWASIWSRHPLTPVEIDGSDHERTLAARIEPPSGPLLVYATVMPWRGDTERDAVSAIDRQVADWAEFQTRFPRTPLCVAGDFNCDMAERPQIYPSKEALTHLTAGLERCGLYVATAPTETPPTAPGRAHIDHIALPLTWREDARVAAAWAEYVGSPRLSDRAGLVVEVR